MRQHSLPLLIGLSISSLFLIAELDRGIFHLFYDSAPALAALADLRLPSFLACLFILILVRKNFPQTPVQPQWRRVISFSLPWLALTGHFIFMRNVWIPQLQSSTDFVAFMVTGLLAEEFLFRGALWELSSEVFKASRLKNVITLLLTAGLFALMHLSYHRYQINESSLTQVAYTFAMGVVLGSVRESSGRLWVAVLVHMLNNSLTVLKLLQ